MTCTIMNKCLRCVFTATEPKYIANVILVLRKRLRREVRNCQNNQALRNLKHVLCAKRDKEHNISAEYNIIDWIAFVSKFEISYTMVLYDIMRKNNVVEYF